MATDHPNRQTIIGRVGLLGASDGIVLGLFEAGCLRFADFPLLMPHVPPSFWFFAPLLTSVAFGLLGLLAGVLAALPRSRFLGMAIIAGFVGLTGAYLALVVRYSQSASVWYPALQRVITPAILFAVVFAWTLPALWATRKPDSPLGFVADVPQRLWSGVVFGSIAALAVAVGISSLPDHLTASTAHATGKAPSPNIVLIVWDTARADHFSSYGYFRNTTPNVDQFAKRGVLFENAISDSSWTLPSTFSMFTSLLPHQHGAGTERAIEPRTLAEILRSGGYETAGFNANPYCGTLRSGLGRGFETYVDSTRSLGYSLAATRIGSEFIEPYSEAWFHRSRFNQFTAHQLNEEVYRWFDRRPDRPFFLFLNYNDAHDPYEVPSPYDHLYGHASKDAKHLLLTAKLSHVSFSSGEREGVIAAYDNALRYIDSQVGELLQFLERSPEWSNTYVIITADHGEGFGEHGTYSHGWNLYRELLHVPLIIAGPGIPAGVRVTDIATTRRIFSTALEFAGVKGAILHRSSMTRLWAPGYVPNNSDEPTLSELVVMWIEPWGTDKSNKTIFLPAPHGSISITTQKWQLICGPGFRRKQLYHWPTDPMERQNVADLPENQAILEQLKESLLSIVERSYRPWRDTAYLEALSGPNFSPGLEALKSIPSLPGGPLLPQGIGAAQALFPPNPETPKNPDQELLESLPYGAR
jgi:arylsulfatase A-like enzyme